MRGHPDRKKVLPVKKAAENRVRERDLPDRKKVLQDRNRVLRGKNPDLNHQGRKRGLPAGRARDRMMEEAGLTVSIPGKGNFVTDDTAGLQHEQRVKQLEAARRELTALRQLGVTKTEAVQLVDDVYGG